MEIDVIAKPTPGLVEAEKGAPNGVATLDGASHLTESQLSPSVVTDNRGSAAEDLLKFNGSSFVRLPKGTTGQQIIVRADGTIGYLDAPEISAEAWGCKFDGVTDDSTALMNAIKQIPAAGGSVRVKNNGVCYVNGATQVVLTGGQRLKGGGWGSVIKGGSGISSGTAVITLNKGGAEDLDGADVGWGLESLCVDGGAVVNGTWGVYLANWSSGSHASSRVAAIDKCLVQNCHVGVRHVNDQGSAVQHTLIQKNDYGVYASDSSQMCAYYKTEFRYNNTVATLLEASDKIIGTSDVIYGWWFGRCQWEANYGKAIVLDGAQNNTWDTCKWEQNGGDYIVAQQVEGLFGNSNNILINPLMNGCATLSPYYNGSSFPYYYRVNAANNDSRLLIIGGTFKGDGANQGINLANSASGNLAILSNIACTVTDTNLTLSRFQDSSTHLSTIYGPDAGTGAAGNPLMHFIAGSEAGNLNAFVGFQKRARFGFFGGSAFVQIDDFGTSKNFRVWLNNGSANATAFQVGTTGQIGLGAAPSVGGATGPVTFQAVATLAPSSNPSNGSLHYTDPTHGQPKIRDQNGNVWTGFANGYTAVGDENFVATSAHSILSYTALTAGRTLELPSATGLAGKTFVIKDQTGSAASHNITVKPTSGTIDGAATQIISTNYGVLRVFCDGANYFVI